MRYKENTAVGNKKQTNITYNIIPNKGRKTFS